MVVGSGAREHALVWKLSQSPRVKQIFTAPGNAGTAQIGQNLNISPTDIDYDTIGDSLKKTTALVTVEQAAASLCLGPHIAAECQRRFFDYLDSPVATISSLDIPNPVSKKLESYLVPSVESVKNVLLNMAGRQI